MRMILNIIDIQGACQLYLSPVENQLPCNPFIHAPMYICLCHNVTENDIRTCVEDGARSMRDLRRELGVASQCGKCACHARDVLKDSLSSSACEKLCGAIAV